MLSRERIRDAALTIIDRGGLSGLSMRRLAAELGVQAASLYKHYPTKDDVLDDIARERDRPGGHVGVRRGRGLAAGAGVVGALLPGGPGRAPEFGARISPRDPAQREEGMQLANAVHGGLVRAGWPPREATLIGAATRHLVLGSTVGSFSRGFVDDVQVYRDRYPHLEQAHLLRSKADEIDTASFELALSAFIDGLQARFDAIDGRRMRRRAAKIRSEH